MSAYAIASPLPLFFDRSGKPLNGGRLYFGLSARDPETDPAQVYWDEALTVVASQPVATWNGMTVRSAGTPAPLYAGQDVSLRVRDSAGRQVLYFQSLAGTSLAAGLAGSTDPSRGAGAMSFSSGIAYPAGTVGAAIKEALQIGPSGLGSRSFYVATVYRQQTEQPSPPVGGAFNFETATITPPVGWSTTQPATTTTPTWACDQMFTTVDASAKVVGGIWGLSYIYAVAGSPGTGGVSRYVMTVYLQSPSQPPAPVGGSYTFSSDTLTPPAGWTREQPAPSGVTKWKSVHVFSTDTPSTPVPAGAWGTPFPAAQTGTLGTLNAGDTISVANFGAIADGTDQTDKIASALAALDLAGGGKLLFPFTGTGGYGLTETLQIPENTTLEFEGSFLKLLGVTTYDAAVIGVPGASNITLLNPLIDCAGVPGGCGIIARRNNSEFRIVGGLIKNAAHDKTRKGGRGLNIEAGVDPAVIGARNLTCSGLVVKDCYEALTISGGADQQDSNIRVDMVAENCQSAIGLFGNADGYPHDVSSMGAHVTMTARNCGKATTYARAHGVVNSDRGSNIKIVLHVMNDASYSPVGSLWRGDASNVSFNAQFGGACSGGLLDFSSYAESDAFPLGANSSLKSVFTVRHSGTAADVVVLPVVSESYLQHCEIDVVTDGITSGKPVTANLANKKSVQLRVKETATNAIFSGSALAIGPDATFAQAADEIFFADASSVKAWVMFTGPTGAALKAYNVSSVTRSSPGVYDVAFSVKPPGGSSTYAIHITSQASSANNQVDDYSNMTNSGFRVQTYSGGVAADKSLVSVSCDW